MRQILFIVFIVLALTACSTDKSQDSSMPSDSAAKGISSYSLEISPEKTSRDSILTLNVKGFQISDSKIEWFVNNKPVANADLYQFKAGELKQGDAVQAVAILKDKKILSNIVQIGNAPPQVESVKFIPETNKISVEPIGRDSDGDVVAFIYEWTKNGEPAGTGSKIDTVLKRGDKITVKITPFDGKDYGRATFVERDIQNSPPVIIEHKNYSYVGGIFTYKIKAEDPDGDALAYTLKTAPQGMIIDKATGLITWKTPLGFIGNGSFTIVVSDKNGGETSQQLTFKINE